MLIHKGKDEFYRFKNWPFLKSIKCKRKKLKDTTLAIQFFCLGKKTKQAFLNFCQQDDNLRRQNGNLPRQNDFSLLFLSYSKLQQQIKLIAYCFLKHITRQALCNTYGPCHVCHLQKEAKRGKVIVYKQQIILNRAKSSNSCLQMCRT